MVRLSNTTVFISKNLVQIVMFTIDVHLKVRNFKKLSEFCRPTYVTLTQIDSNRLKLTQIVLWLNILCFVKVCYLLLTLSTQISASIAHPIFNQFHGPKIHTYLAIPNSCNVQLKKSVKKLWWENMKKCLDIFFAFRNVRKDSTLVFTILL